MLKIKAHYIDTISLDVSLDCNIWEWNQSRESMPRFWICSYDLLTGIFYGPGLWILKTKRSTNGSLFN